MQPKCTAKLDIYCVPSAGKKHKSGTQKMGEHQSR